MYGQQTGADKLVFLYDANGSVYGFTYNGASYYYHRNIQGDVLGIYDSTGTELVTYSYDAWGLPTGMTDTSTNGIGTINPIRYRGYLYDAELGFYWLTTRFYDPEIGRFINADDAVPGATGSVVGYSLYEYGVAGKVIETGAVAASSARMEFTLQELQYPNYRIKYNVPLYYQGNTNLCWAFCQVMVENYWARVHCDNTVARQQAKMIAIERNGEDWNRGNNPENIEKISSKSMDGIFHALMEYGPLYAVYGTYDQQGKRTGHAVVITGIDLERQIIYTNNPWNIRGSQTYEEFLDGFAGVERGIWHFEECYYFY